MIPARAALARIDGDEKPGARKTTIPTSPVNPETEPYRAPGAACTRAAAILIIAGSLGSCAFPPRDVHLAPLYSYHQTGGGGSAHEALGGILEYRSIEPRNGSTTGVEYGFHPIFRHRSEQDFEKAIPADGQRSETDVIWPLGHFRSDSEEGYGRFFPFWWWQRHTNEQGQSEVDWALFPLLFAGSGSERNSYFAFFPIYGKLRDYFTYDEITFLLFPLYGSTLKNPGNQRSYGILPPFSGWGSTDDGSSWWRAWPFYGHSTKPGHYNRSFAMWPFWHSESNNLDTGSPSNEWLFWPFYGEVDQGAAHSRSILWPLIGWNWNDETGYSAWDGPWPLVKSVRNGSGHPFAQTRVLPFYARYESKEINSSSYLWPIVWIREETTPGFHRDSTYVVPFYYGSTTNKQLAAAAPDGSPVNAEGSSTLVWPLYRHEHTPEGDTHAEALWPLPYPKLYGFRENWWPFFSLYSFDERPDSSATARVFLDLFRYERDERSTRWSVPFLGGRAGYADGSAEWSVLLGLIRWRSGENGSRFLLPAFPGPGFTSALTNE